MPSLPRSSIISFILSQSIVAAVLHIYPPKAL
jgi:hypothetical protein